MNRGGKIRGGVWGKMRKSGGKGVSPADVYVALVTGAAFVSTRQLRRFEISVYSVHLKKLSHKDAIH